MFALIESELNILMEHMLMVPWCVFFSAFKPCDSGSGVSVQACWRWSDQRASVGPYASHWSLGLHVLVHPTIMPTVNHPTAFTEFQGALKETSLRKPFELHTELNKCQALLRISDGMWIAWLICFTPFHVLLIMKANIYWELAMWRALCQANPLQAAFCLFPTATQ